MTYRLPMQKNDQPEASQTLAVSVVPITGRKPMMWKAFVMKHREELMV